MTAHDKAKLEHDILYSRKNMSPVNWEKYIDVRCILKDWPNDDKELNDLQLKINTKYMNTCTGIVLW